MQEKQYFELSGLEAVYLEDSYVLGIAKTATSVAFHLDVVLRENHPNYSQPRANEHYCYRKAVLTFPDVAKIEWSNIEKRQVFRDASGDVDYGNIDTFVKRAGRFCLSGDWGSVEIKSADPELRFVEC